MAQPATSPATTTAVKPSIFTLLTTVTLSPLQQQSIADITSPQFQLPQKYLLQPTINPSNTTKNELAQFLQYHDQLETQKYEKFMSRIQNKLERIDQGIIDAQQWRQNLENIAEAMERHQEITNNIQAKKDKMKKQCERIANEQVNIYSQRVGVCRGGL